MFRLALLKHPVRVVNSLLRPMNLQLVNRTNPTDDDLLCYPVTLAHRLTGELAGVAADFLEQHLPGVPGGLTREQMPSVVEQFFELNRRRPIRRNLGGSRFHNCFWLYVTARHLRPELIVESGVWRGQSTWFLREASPEAELHCFDLDFGTLDYRDPKAHYHQRDWSEVEVHAGADPLRSLCFFDDHQNQALRIRQAQERGFRLLLFDDNIPAHKLYTDRWPPLPTIDMLLTDSVRPGETIEWVIGDQPQSWTCRAEDLHDAKRLVRRAVTYPDISARTKYATHAFMSLVEVGAS